MTTDQKQFLKDLSERYDLTKDDFFKHPTQAWVIITRIGIDKIQAKANIEVDFSINDYNFDKGSIIIQAYGKMGDKRMQSFGEASPDNYKTKANVSRYPIAIAEKRALSRVVLKLVGAYAQGIYSEDESDDFKN